MRPVVAQLAPSVRSWPSTSTRPDGRPVEGHHQADQRALAGSARPDQRRRRAGRARETTRASAPARRRCTRSVTSSNVDLAADVRQRRAAGVLLILGRHRAGSRGCDRGRRTPRVSCVPIDASWMTGIVISAVKARYITRSPIVIGAVADRRCRRSASSRCRWRRSPATRTR